MSLQIHHDDDHTVEVLDEVNMTFMALITDRLNQTLRKNGVDDPAQREEICSSFVFGLAYQLDAGWFEHEGTRFFPNVCFVERGRPGPEDNLGPVEHLHLPTEASSLHEYATGVVSQYFEDDETLDPPVKTGSYDSPDDA